MGEKKQEKKQAKQDIKEQKGIKNTSIDNARTTWKKTVQTERDERDKAKDTWKIAKKDDTLTHAEKKEAKNTWKGEKKEFKGEKKEAKKEFKTDKRAAVQKFNEMKHDIKTGKKDAIQLLKNPLLKLDTITEIFESNILSYNLKGTVNTCFYRCGLELISNDFKLNTIQNINNTLILNPKIIPQPKCTIKMGYEKNTYLFKNFIISIPAMNQIDDKRHNLQTCFVFKDTVTNSFLLLSILFDISNNLDNIKTSIAERFFRALLKHSQSPISIIPNKNMKRNLPGNNTFNFFSPIDFISIDNNSSPSYFKYSPSSNVVCIIIEDISYISQAVYTGLYSKLYNSDIDFNKKINNLNKVTLPNTPTIFYIKAGLHMNRNAAANISQFTNKGDILNDNDIVDNDIIDNDIVDDAFDNELFNNGIFDNNDTIDNMYNNLITSNKASAYIEMYKPHHAKNNTRRQLHNINNIINPPSTIITNDTTVATTSGTTSGTTNTEEENNTDVNTDTTNTTDDTINENSHFNTAMIWLILITLIFIQLFYYISFYLIKNTILYPDYNTLKQYYSYITEIPYNDLLEMYNNKESTLYAKYDTFLNSATFQKDITIHGKVEGLLNKIKETYSLEAVDKTLPHSPNMYVQMGYKNLLTYEIAFYVILFLLFIFLVIIAFSLISHVQIKYVKAYVLAFTIITLFSIAYILYYRFNLIKFINHNSIGGEYISDNENFNKLRFIMLNLPFYDINNLKAKLTNDEKIKFGKYDIGAYKSDEVVTGALKDIPLFTDPIVLSLNKSEINSWGLSMLFYFLLFGLIFILLIMAANRLQFKTLNIMSLFSFVITVSLFLIFIHKLGWRSFLDSIKEGFKHFDMPINTESIKKKKKIIGIVFVVIALLFTYLLNHLAAIYAFAGIIAFIMMYVMFKFTIC